MAVAMMDRVKGKIKGAEVQVVNLTKDFGAVRAVDDVSLKVQAGEFLVIVGPSGSGKTTILMTIAGFQQPTLGEVLIGGRSVSTLPPYRRDIGMVFQSYALFPHMSVADNVGFPLRMRHIPSRERAKLVQAALGMVLLSGYESRRPDQLSGGQQQRVALARALVFRPSVVLMDEPLGALDRKLRDQMQLEIKHLQQQLGITMIHVTHDQEEALTMADSIAVMKLGRLQQVDTPEAIYERPANTFVADFIGESNSLNGRIISLNGEIGTVAIEGGPTIRATLSEGAAASQRRGASVQVMVRPGRVVVCGEGEAGGAGYSGVVEETVYAGESSVCIVRLGLATTVRARVPSGGSQRQWQAGDTVEVLWRPEDAGIYEAHDW